MTKSKYRYYLIIEKNINSAIEFFSSLLMLCIALVSFKNVPYYIIFGKTVLLLYFTLLLFFLYAIRVLSPPKKTLFSYRNHTTALYDLEQIQENSSTPMTICVKNKKQLIMKKKLLGVGFVFCSIVAISLAALNGRVKSYSGVSLADLVSTTEVNAECAQGSDWFASGKCLSGTGVCVFSVEYRDCVRISNLILVGGAVALPAS